MAFEIFSALNRDQKFWKANAKFDLKVQLFFERVKKNSVEHKLFCEIKLSFEVGSLAA